PARAHGSRAATVDPEAISEATGAAAVPCMKDRRDIPFIFRPPLKKRDIGSRLLHRAHTSRRPDLGTEETARRQRNWNSKALNLKCLLQAVMTVKLAAMLYRILFATLLLSSCTGSQTISLFNGEDLSGWIVDVPEADSNPNLPPSFIVRDGMLVSTGNPRRHLITQESYSNYRLVAEYRFPGEPGNCGILVHSSTPRALSNMFPQSIEVQL